MNHSFAQCTTCRPLFCKILLNFTDHLQSAVNSSISCWFEGTVAVMFTGGDILLIRQTLEDYQHHMLTNISQYPSDYLPRHLLTNSQDKLEQIDPILLSPPISFNCWWCDLFCETTVWIVTIILSMALIKVRVTCNFGLLQSVKSLNCYFHQYRPTSACICQSVHIGTLFCGMFMAHLNFQNFCEQQYLEHATN